jgi:hypothetical protein
MGRSQLSRGPFDIICSYLDHKSHASFSRTNYMTALTCRTAPINLIIEPYNIPSLRHQTNCYSSTDQQPKQWW